ncbi:MAG: FecR domain-containing protein [Pseudobacter sp.]|uniref:FecR domain-containing protein n=1 Tax=Pseudobacter sp. TaxID=2045420 RepID=UPI003F7E749F
MTQENFHELLDKYVTGELNQEDQLQLFRLLEQPEYSRLLQERLQGDWDNSCYEEHANDLLKGVIVSSVNRKIDSIEKPSAPIVHRVHFLRKWGWAAAVVILASTVVFALIYPEQSQHGPEESHVIAAPIMPGKEGALLTLADGSQVLLDTVKNGEIALQGGAAVKVINGVLVYDGKGKEAVYNTMSTPRGRQFQLTLPDGTLVWLNASSSIRYPTQFAGKERSVSVTGEAYFEVAKNDKIPFKVIIGEEAQVEVLGTHFNVNAFENEHSIKTTLLEGSIRTFATKGTGEKMILQPGQQAQIEQGSIKKVKANLSQVVAWKNGVFDFNDITFDAAMRQLERWYDIEVVYTDGIPEDVELSGEITKGVTLDGLLNVLKKIGVTCRLEGRKLLILP